MIEVCNYINKKLKETNINYAFLRWNADVVYPYFVGEYEESDPNTETQEHSATFIITGFTRNTWKELELVRQKIENLFDEHHAILDSGSGVVISYSGAFPIPIDEGELKKIQININIIEWRVK